MKILEKKTLRDWLSEIRFTGPAIEKLMEIADIVSKDRALLDYFHQYYQEEILSGHWMDRWDIESMDEKVVRAFGEERSLFYLLCYLNHLSFTKERYLELKISGDIYIATLSDIGIWLENWKNMYGYYCFHNFGWIWRHLTADLFRIGRLQYQLLKYNGDFNAYQKKSTSTIVVFSTNNLAINRDGNAVGAGEIQNDSAAFTTTFYEKENCIVGTPITPYGKALNHAALLKKSVWRPILKKNSSVLAIHIPRGEKLSMEEGRQSYQDALAFYQKIFNASDIAGLTCHTWIFTPQLQDILEPQSNLVRFQREFYLLPFAGNYKFMWNFVFNEKTTLENAPQDTYLRRKLVEYVKEKKLLFDTMGICLHPDEDWGRQMDMVSYDKGDWERDVYESI